MTSAEANVYTAKLNLDYTEIRAPISGRIGREIADQVTREGVELLVVDTDPERREAAEEAPSQGKKPKRKRAVYNPIAGVLFASFIVQ